MDDFSESECRALAEVIGQIIMLMQMIDRRTVLPIPSIPKGTYTVRKQSRQATRPKARTSKTMVCPAPQKAAPKRKVTRKAAAPKTAGNTTMGFIDDTGNCVCPMPGRAVTRSMTASKRTAPVITRRLKAKNPATKSLKTAVHKQKVRRQNRKRPATKKPKARKAVMECS